LEYILTRRITYRYSAVNLFGRPENYTLCRKEARHQGMVHRGRGSDPYRAAMRWRSKIEGIGRLRDWQRTYGYRESNRKSRVVIMGCVALDFREWSMYLGGVHPQGHLPTEPATLPP